MATVSVKGLITHSDLLTTNRSQEIQSNGIARTVQREP